MLLCYYDFFRVFYYFMEILTKVLATEDGVLLLFSFSMEMTSFLRK